MITVFQVKLDLKKSLRTNNIGSVLHGVIMELIPTEVADYLHTGGSYSPLKQRILFQEDYVTWEIACLTEFIAVEIDEVFKHNKSVFIRHHDEHVAINCVDKEVYEIESLIEKFFSEDIKNRYVKLHIMTPTSFKSQGKYEIYPDVRKIFRSIMIQYDTFFDSYKMHDHETLDFIGEKINIVDYRLRSTRFYLERTRIPAFVGQITLQLNGPTHFQQLLIFLLFIGQFTGVGVKTSLGMGKYQLV